VNNGTTLSAPRGDEAIRARKTVLDIVIPAFNEAGRLPASLERIGQHLSSSSRWLDARLIVVDDGSSDDTARAAGAVELPSRVSLQLLSHEKNRGKGAAVRTGLAATAAALVLITDADLAAPIEELDRLAATAGENVMVIGSRALQRELIFVRQPAYRDLMGRTFNLLVRALLVPDIRDTQCGFKLLPGRLARSLATVQRLDGFAYDVELLLLARRWGYQLREVPVRWHHVEASRVAPLKHSLQMLRDIFRLAWRRARGTLPGEPGRTAGS
jgi:dolichyl-phosphate beta-glucosyltransferase